jgi:hypothetical protein
MRPHMSEAKSVGINDRSKNVSLSPNLFGHFVDKVDVLRGAKRQAFDQSRNGSRDVNLNSFRNTPA